MIAGLTYGDLDTTLRQLGYTRHEQPERVVHEYADDTEARLIYPVLPITQEVRGIDLLATRKIVDGFGTIDER